ncbi:nucleolin [Dendropsophus ebraccatus]|uniref:nucleolin n=1 Tax=Dendropsophus ebraccatus TaxID=150705 RepID=UPI003831750D
MVKLAKGAKAQGKPKKAPPPKEVAESDDEEMEDSEEEMEVPVKTPSKKANTPAKATPGKKAATPAKAAVTPGKKGATPAGAKNGKKAKKQESEDEEESEEEESEDEKPVAKKPAAKKPVAKKEESEDDEEDDDDEDDDDEDDESEEEKKPAAKKPIAKKAAAKKQPKKTEDEDDDDEGEEAMEVAPPVVKGKKAAAPKKEESEDEEDDDDEDDDDDDEDDEEDDEDDEGESGKRKKEMPKNKAAPENKKQKTDGSEGLSIYVANLNASKDFDELKDALREFFSKNSLPVQDVRIGSARKFGYVDFSSVEEVEQAIKLNGKKVLGFEIKIEKANTAAEKTKNAENKRERDARTLFVKNLPYSTGVEELQEIFENAKEIRLPTGKDGSSKGIAYVEFNTEAEADKAIEEKQGTEVEGRSIFIDYTGDKSQMAGGRRGAGVGADSKVLVVNNLAYSATEDSLQEVFKNASSIRIPQNNQGRPKGFAFVEFSSVEEAKEALESVNNTEIEGRSIRIEFSQGGPQGSVQSKTLFVKGLSEDTTEETLKDAFDGSLNARIVTDRDTGASKGFGFVDFSTTEDAKAAKDAMEDGEIDGSKVTLDFAKPKGEGQRGGGRGGRGGFGGRGRGGFGGRGGGGRGGFGGRGGGRGFGGRGGGRGGFGGRGGGGFRGGNQGQGKKTKFDD